MTAYGAVNSLRNTIDYILHSSHFILVDPSPRILQLAYEELDPLQDILEKLDSTRISKSRKKVNGLDGRIKELIWEFEDLLESPLYQQILSQSCADQVDDEMKERVWEFGGLLESIPSQPHPQLIFQSPPPHPTTSRRRRKLVVHKHKGRKFNTPRITNESEASQSRSLEDEDEMKERVWEFGGFLESLPSQPQPQPQFIFPKSRRRKRRKLVVHKHKGRKLNAPRFSIDLQFLQHDVGSFMERLKDMEEEYIYQVDYMPEDDDDEDESLSSRSGTKSKLIGLSYQFEQLKNLLMGSYPIGKGKYYFAIVGAAGVGKTALVEAVFEDPKISSHFEHRAWVRVGRKSQFDDVSREILAQMFGITQGDHELGAYLKGGLRGKSCGLIVLDDVWETQIVDSLVKSIPDIIYGSISILVTTRDRNTTSPLTPSETVSVPFLNERESKELLCEKVFGEKDCPYQLDKAVTKIAKKCEGLPLMIVTVADILSKAQNIDPEYWDEVAEMQNSVFTDAYNAISKVLFPSYDYLPQHLKMPFLYMGLFPSDYDIPLSKLMSMLATENWFHNTKKEQSLKDYVWICLHELCRNRNLVLSNNRYYVPSFDIDVYKTCRLHSSWRHMCRGEARKNKFYHVLNKLAEGLEDGVKGQRCLCLENNILFSIKDFCDSVRSNCASSARSLLFFGPYHQYPILVGDYFKLLGKLDALNLRFYTFPIEILTLFLLKYLALTCNGELPPTISKLFNLRVLIIHPHSNIRICRAPSYVPIEIWDMQELEHIEILGKSLVAPSHSASLDKLSTIKGVNANICTISELSRKVPCIRKLGVQIELAPYDNHDDLLSCFGCVSTLGSLETLKCSITNPVFKYDYAFPSSLVKFPSWLKKLYLSGMGFSWEYMDVIGSLHSLQVLKLRAYAFRGSKWETQPRSFLKLRILLIEDSDLVQWKPRYGSFPILVRLSLKHCYKLEEIHWPSHYMLGAIELVNCNPVALTCAKKLRPDPETLINVTASFSFDEKPVTLEFERIAYIRRIKRKDAAGFLDVPVARTLVINAANVYEEGSFDDDEFDSDEEGSGDATEPDFDEEGSFDATESDNDVEDEDAQDVPDAVDEADE